jgi:hypothetical protein
VFEGTASFSHQNIEYDENIKLRTVAQSGPRAGETQDHMAGSGQPGRARGERSGGLGRPLGR